jgi:CrcB protein
MVKLLLVGIGGFLGSMARYALSLGVYRLTGTAFPFGTLVVNIIGCAAIGILVAIGEARNALSPEARAFLMIGVLGGFTTFSSFAHETLLLGKDATMLRAGMNVVLHFAGCLVAVWLGYVVTRSMLSAGV